MSYTCPGLNDYVRPKPEYKTCPECSSDVEIWSDEDESECSDCGNKIFRKVESCLKWCEYSQKCKQIIQEKMSKQ